MKPNGSQNDIFDPSLAGQGLDRIAWAERDMPVLRMIRTRFGREKPLVGLRIAACLHVTSETANLVIALKDGGASVRLCASNPLSTQDDVAGALVVEHDIPTFAVRGEDNQRYYQHIQEALAETPHVTLDDGADLVATIHGERRDLIPHILGGTEETTTGVVRLRSLAAEGLLAYPILAVNEADTKHFFDNRYGTGQSTIDGITRATNVLWAGKVVVVAGYGWCGRGVAVRARGLGAQIIVTELDPIRALEAVMDGYRVMTMMEAAPVADILITVTGDIAVIDKKHLAVLKDGAMLANSGHFDVEINIPALVEMSVSKRVSRPHVEEYLLGDGRRIYLLAAGRLVNLAAAEGHPAAVMDMSFANQALSVEHLVKTREVGLPVGVHPVPSEIDKEVGRLKLQSLGINIDEPTAQQEEYLGSWTIGT